MSRLWKNVLDLLWQPPLSNQHPRVAEQLLKRKELSGDDVKRHLS